MVSSKADEYRPILKLKFITGIHKLELILTARVCSQRYTPGVYNIHRPRKQT